MGRNYCSACAMLRAGVKFRIAPKHTCGKKPISFIKTGIRFPKVDPDDYYEIIIQRGGLIETGKAKKIVCAAQEIEGVKIPRGFEIWIPETACLDIKKTCSSIPSIEIKGWKINEVLKTLFIDQLRHG